MIGGGLGTRFGVPGAERIAGRDAAAPVRARPAAAVVVTELDDAGGALGAALLVA